jgi:hypothetical protein
VRLEAQTLGERLERHPLPQSTLSTPLFLGVEAPVLAFEVIMLVAVLNVAGLRLVPVVLVSAALAALHVALAAATRRDRRLSLVFARSLRYPRHAHAHALRLTFTSPAEPSFPRRLLA